MGFTLILLCPFPLISVNRSEVWLSVCNTQFFSISLPKHRSCGVVCSSYPASLEWRVFLFHILLSCLLAVIACLEWRSAAIPSSLQNPTCIEYLLLGLCLLNPLNCHQAPAGEATELASSKWHVCPGPAAVAPTQPFTGSAGEVGSCPASEVRDRCPSVLLSHYLDFFKLYIKYNCQHHTAKFSIVTPSSNESNYIK